MRQDEHPDSGGILALRMYRCTKLIIAAINGAAVGVGLTMTLPMDIRIAAQVPLLTCRILSLRKSFPLWAEQGKGRTDNLTDSQENGTM